MKESVITSVFINGVEINLFREVVFALNIIPYQSYCYKTLKDILIKNTKFIANEYLLDNRLN